MHPSQPLCHQSRATTVICKQSPPAHMSFLSAAAQQNQRTLPATMSTQDEKGANGSLQQADHLQVKQHGSPPSAPAAKAQRNDSPGTPPMDSKDAILDRVGFAPLTTSLECKSKALHSPPSNAGLTSVALSPRSCISKAPPTRIPSKSSFFLASTMAAGDSSHRKLPPPPLLHRPFPHQNLAAVPQPSPSHFAPYFVTCFSQWHS